MSTREAVTLDDTDWAMLAELQRDARISIAALARAVHLGPTATTERLNRLRDSGVIRSFSAVVDPAAVGLGLTAFIRMRPAQGASKAFREAVADMANVQECHHVTGEDCYLVKVVARDIGQLETITDQIAGYGATTTSVAYASLVERKAVTADA